MKKRYARAKPIKKESEENKITKWDIVRTLINDIRNLECAVKATKKYAKKFGRGEAQIALSYTTSPVHTVEYYVELAKQVEAIGADSICIKDMAGVLLPQTAYDLITAIKKNTKLPVELHSHCTGGLMGMTYMRAIEAGVDIIDTALSPLAGGTSQPCTESVCYALQGTEYDSKIAKYKIQYCCVYAYGFSFIEINTI